MENRAGRWWAVVILAGLVVAGTIVVSASTAAPPPDQFYKRLLAEETKFTAYPDIAVGEGGLVVSVWTEGPGSVADRHLGPVILAWISDSAEGWETTIVDASVATEAVVAVAGATAHVVWIKNGTPWPKEIYYNSCDLSQAGPTCTPRELVAAGGQEGTASKVSQVNIALDQSGAIHAVWSEGDLRGLYYSSKSSGQNWTGKGLVWDEDSFTSVGVSDFPAMAVNYIGDADYVHLVWAQEIATLDSTYHIAKYCRRDVIGGFWGECELLADIFAGNHYYPARNLSIAADGKGNVYAVWDLLVDHNPSKREYAIGYKHSPDNGLVWRATRTYRYGYDAGFQAEIFRSGEDASDPEPVTGEYAHFLRPRISLATSGTLTTPVPVLTWHAQVLPGGGSAPELAQLVEQPVHKVFWTYATQPGSDNSGSLFWASDYITLSTDFCGELDMNVNSATVNLAIVGDLNNVKDGGQPAGPDRLHAVFHEEIGEDAWGVYYTGYVTVDCFKVYLSLVFQRYASGGRR